MGLGNYALECEQLVEELRTSLDESEVAELRGFWQGRPVLDWIRWRNANETLISDFVGATPSERSKKKFKEHRLLLTMAGIQHCLEAQALLTIIDGSDLIPGGSYRSMAAAAGRAFNRLYAFESPCWPFDELDSPFPDDPSNE